ncbi:MAG: FtsX-like permease family protein [Deinococcaceae bacterium]
MFHILKFTWIRAKKRPVRTLLSVLQLSLGAAFLSVAMGVMFPRLLPQQTFSVIAGSPNGDIYSLFQTTDIDSLLKLSPHVATAEVFESDMSQNMEYRGKLYKLGLTRYVGPRYGDVAGVRMLQGNFIREPDEAVVSKRFSEILFGSEYADRLLDNNHPIGRAFTVIDRQNIRKTFKVVGVMENPSGQSDAQLFLGLQGLKEPLSSLAVRSRLGANTVAKSEILAAIRANYKEHPAYRKNKGTLNLQSIDKQEEMQVFALSKTDTMLLILVASFCAVILFACAVGIFTIQFVDTVERTREVGLRRTLGASKGSVVWERLIESMVWSIPGAVIGFWLTSLLLPGINGQLRDALTVDRLELSPSVFIAVQISLFFISLLASWYPAVQSTRLSPTAAMREIQ